MSILVQRRKTWWSFTLLGSPNQYPLMRQPQLEPQLEQIPRFVVILCDARANESG